MWPEKNSKEHHALSLGLGRYHVMVKLFGTVTEVCEYDVVQVSQYCEVGIIIPILKLRKVSLEELT